jgi:hypothetical protein
MIRAAIRFGVLYALLAEIFAVAAFASAQDWNAADDPKPTISLGDDMSGHFSKDDPAKVSPLIVTGDFNRDGIADIARITLHPEDTSEPRPVDCITGSDERYIQSTAFQVGAGANSSGNGCR